jgi:hypothetical protein
MSRELAERFLNTFNQLHEDNLEPLHEIYADDIHFIDPIREVRGVEELKKVLKHQYSAVKVCVFENVEICADDNRAFVAWIMRVELENFRRGETLRVDGSSRLHFNDAGKITFHQDYYDMGQFIYERVLGLGMVIRKIKQRM